MSVQTPPVPTGASAPEENRKSWFARHKFLTGLGVFVLLIIAISSGSGGSTDTSASSDSGYSSTDDGGSKDTAASSDSSADEATANEDEPAMTAAQENALESAKSYLDMSGFSRLGLIQQLSSKAGEGYSRADATFAVDHLNVDWNKQAVRSAKDYLDMSSFSRSGLIEQLSSKAGDGYTHAQAVYAADHVGL